MIDNFNKSKITFVNKQFLINPRKDDVISGDKPLTKDDIPALFSKINYALVGQLINKDNVEEA